jgi:ribosomal protein S18 acetylase RimI-like enzyme
MEKIPSKEKSPIEIGHAVESDAEGIQNVFYRTWLATYPNEEAGITVDDIKERKKDALSEENIDKAREQIKNSDEGVSLFVARDNGIVIGICRVQNQSHKNQLRAIYVLPEHQGRGIGSMLWEQARNTLNMENDTFVEVVTYNKNAIDFYSRLGFVDTGRRIEDENFRMKSGAIMNEMEMVLPGKK